MLSPLLTVDAINREFILSAQALPYVSKHFTSFGPSAQFVVFTPELRKLRFPTKKSWKAL